MSGKLIFTKASGIKNQFSRLILSIFKYSGLWIFFYRICKVKEFFCIGPSAEATAVTQPTHCVYRVPVACEWANG